MPLTLPVAQARLPVQNQPDSARLFGWCSFTRSTLLGPWALFRGSDLQVRHKNRRSSALAAEELPLVGQPILAVQRPTQRMLIRRATLLSAVVSVLFLAPALRAETVVLRSGLRINVTSYELLGEKYRLQLSGGMVEVPAEEVATIEPQLLFTSEPPKAEPAATGPYREFIQSASEKYKVDADLISSVIAIESNFDPKAISRRNARGLMQLMPQTASRLGVKNIFDPKENIDGGTHLLRDLLQRYNNDLVLALAAYNAGPERVVTAVPPIRETRTYVVKVKKNYDKRKDNHKETQRKSAAAELEPAKPDGNPLL